MQEALAVLIDSSRLNRVVAGGRFNGSTDSTARPKWSSYICLAWPGLAATSKSRLTYGPNARKRARHFHCACSC